MSHRKPTLETKEDNYFSTSQNRERDLCKMEQDLDAKKRKNYESSVLRDQIRLKLFSKQEKDSSLGKIESGSSSKKYFNIRPSTGVILHEMCLRPEILKSWNYGGLHTKKGSNSHEILTKWDTNKATK